MPFVPSPNVAEAELRFYFDGQLMENTLYFQLGSAPEVEDLQLLGSALIDWYSGNIDTLQSVACQLLGVQVTDLTTAVSPSVFMPATLGTGGTVESPYLPTNCSWTVQFKTAGRGRSSQGRNYVIGLCESHALGSTIDPTTASNYVNAYNVLASGGSFESGWVWGVLSRISGGVDRVSGLFQTITVAAYADLLLDSQRRRLPGRGR